VAKLKPASWKVTFPKESREWMASRIRDESNKNRRKGKVKWAFAEWILKGLERMGKLKSKWARLGNSKDEIGNLGCFVSKSRCAWRRHLSPYGAGD